MPDNEQRSFSSLWLASPLLLAVVGLIGTGVGAISQGFWNTRLEREKFEFGLIAKALDTNDKDNAAKNLRFLIEAGLINSVSAEKIKSLASNPPSLPSFAPRPEMLGAFAAKIVLSRLGIYQGPIDDEASDAYRSAVQQFQRSQNEVPDGIVGPRTFSRMLDEYRKMPPQSPPPDGKGEARQAPAN
jgi:Putative peptidoglycan binding domain